MVDMIEQNDLCFSFGLRYSLIKVKSLFSLLGSLLGSQFPGFFVC